MAGIYIHIPFCKQACTYCNFHFSTNLSRKTDMLNAIKREIQDRKEELAQADIRTIYFGGGTPSLLSAKEINDILQTIGGNYKLTDDMEITLEANPDDLTEDYLKSLRFETSINRLSIGLQSFVEEDLKLMNRAHNAKESLKCLDYAHKLDFYNLSVDLIYGSPNLSNEAWKRNLSIVFDYAIPHLSCYALTVEEKTALAHLIQKKQIQNLSEDKAAEQFEILLEQIYKNGYEQYEISNFCRPPHYAKHNTSYWKGELYMGIGPSAHSFDGKSRRWNLANNALYLKNMENHIPFYEEELLSPKDIFNEYMLTAFRTKWGVDLHKLAKLDTFEQEHFYREATPHINAGNIILENNTYRLSDSGKLLADHIISDLFI